ncbi:hypothetical protein NIE88_21505 [Sporolactobacillus shoreicorticis]|uniref:Regulatory protein YycH-like domain-containing protein n=1 Tax=Sporolactobacillus shoreicorticis TaxID=1923877 RepID=A0ABW5S2U2_9BACL|nr:hypothetical protein [Sporolactobacillus shoreicorticis]MCO7128307.1 hypothetical protein [Sporolactobacillus shoreicorticis]
MRLKRVQILTLLITAAAVFSLLIFPFLLLDRPTITYFPEHPRIQYVTTATHLAFVPENQLLRLQTASETKERNELMQDFSLLYRNNQLVAILNRWQKNVSELSASKELDMSPGFYVGLTVHQAERHIDHSIYGKEQLSQDYLMAVKTNGTYHLYREPKTTDEANQLSQYTRELGESRNKTLRRAAARYGFQLSDYRVVPLDALTGESFTHIFPFGREKAERITGQLWEGLYKNYVRGIQLAQAQSESPLGSTMPLLLIAQDHMLIVFETANRQTVLLKQNFS